MTVSQLVLPIIGSNKNAKSSPSHVHIMEEGICFCNYMIFEEGSDRQNLRHECDQVQIIQLWWVIPPKNAPVTQSRNVGFPRLLYRSILSTGCVGGFQFTSNIGKDGYTFNCGHLIGLTYGLCTSFNGTLVSWLVDGRKGCE